MIWNERERGREREREERKGENALPPINRKDKHNIIITHPLNGSDAIVVLDVGLFWVARPRCGWGWRQAPKVLKQGAPAAFCKSSHLASRSGHTKGKFRA